MTRHINRRNIQGKEGWKRERKTDREKERRQKERKKERVFRQERKKESTCYILTNKCCTWLRMTRHINRDKKVRETKRQRERKKERKEERKKEW